MVLSGPPLSALSQQMPGFSKRSPLGRLAPLLMGEPVVPHDSVVASHELTRTTMVLFMTLVLFNEMS